MFLTLTKIRMPVGALASIGHRISGVILALSVPAAVYAFDLSLRDELGFARVMAMVDRLPVKAAIVIIVWALAHHLLDGVRHVLTDFDIGSPLRIARRSAWFVNVAGVVVAVVTLGAIW